MAEGSTFEGRAVTASMSPSLEQIGEAIVPFVAIDFEGEFALQMPAQEVVRFAIDLIRCAHMAIHDSQWLDALMPDEVPEEVGKFIVQTMRERRVLDMDVEG